ncbi:hypothetical protein Sme01_26950 [Sphaerisporangium melleum]|uniref:Uncharacterized protein n=1 Tax=Sphaerisporangium melleum TaxID=321316 RepID=A0A917VFY4_9ACTN|nr:hypothetical protein GCM10007964_12390 [Sphaerisporangium melleum]GII70219.1 hypothetical protein Sme01_26950 [Sphaerisporangium melleum]
MVLRAVKGRERVQRSGLRAGLNDETGGRRGEVAGRPAGKGGCRPRWCTGPRRADPSVCHAMIRRPDLSGTGIAQSERTVTIGARRFPPVTEAGAPPEIR